MTAESKRVDELMNEWAVLREANKALTDANSGYVKDLQDSRDANKALIDRCLERESEIEKLNKRKRKIA